MKILIMLFLIPFAVNALELEQFLTDTLKTHPAVEQSRFELDAQEQSLSGVSTLEDPMIGWMKEGEMKSWTLSQNLKFPYKYKVAKDIQRSKILSGRVGLEKVLWNYRSKVLSALFRYDFALQNINFIEAQRVILKEALKLMASRRADGVVKQQEELRSYLELTKLETDLLVQNQNVDEARSELEALVGDSNLGQIPQKLERPNVKLDLIKEFQDYSGLDLRLSLANLNQVEQERSMARWEYIPDFKLTTKQPLESSQGVKSYGVEMTFPLWIWGKQWASSSAASSRLYAQRKNVELLKREQKSKIQSLSSKIENMQKLLVLYETSLLPQAKSNLDSALSSYKVGGVRFLELVEAQKILYSERMNYLDNTLKFVDAVLEVEQVLGKKVSSFPKGVL